MMSILNVARMGKLSSDRKIDEYATDIWQVKPAKGYIRQPVLYLIQSTYLIT